MLSQKLQDDLMTAYQKVYEEKTGHAAGDSDMEKQASQLASDVRYKAKGKVPQGATEEEKRKIFLQILGASPAPNAVKAMARQKLIGEEVEVKEGIGQEMFDKNKIGGGKKIEKKQVELPKFKNTDNPDFKKPEKKVTEEMSPKEVLAKKMKEKKINKLIKKDAKQNVKTEKELASAMMGEAKVDSTKIFNVGGDRNVRRFGKEGQFNPDGSGPRGQDLSQKAKLAAQRGKEHKERRGVKTGAGGYTPSGTMDEGSAYGITKGDGMSFPERLKKKVKEKKKKVTEGFKEIDKKKENKMYRRAGNLARQSISSDNEKEKYDKAKKSANIVSAITRQKEKKRFDEIGKTRAADLRNDSYEPEGELVDEQLKDTNYGRVVGNQKKDKKQITKTKKPMNTGGDGTAYMGEAKKAKKDYDGDGKVESGTQEFLGSRDKAIKKAIAKRRGRYNEGFSAWRIDLDFNESVKK